jgi:EAL domain-containing protein (putative c-di-GMP-specific phosphodiesterase class I)
MQEHAIQVEPVVEEAWVRRAIKRPNEHLTAVLQPVFNVLSGEFYGYEVLLRAAFGNRSVRPDLLIQSAYALELGRQLEAKVLRRQFDTTSKVAKQLHRSGRVRASFNVRSGFALSHEFRDVMKSRPNNVDVALEIVEEGLPYVHVDNVKVLDLRILGRVTRELQDTYGCAVLIDDLLDKGTTFNTLGGLLLQGARPSAIKLSHQKTRGFWPNASPSDLRESTDTLLKALALLRLEFGATLAAGNGGPVRLVAEGMQDMETLYRLGGVIAGASVPVFGQGFFWDFVVGDLSATHARAPDVQGLLDIPGHPVYLQATPLGIERDVGAKFCPS